MTVSEWIQVLGLSVAVITLAVALLTMAARQSNESHYLRNKHYQDGYSDGFADAVMDHESESFGKHWDNTKRGKRA